MSGEVSAPGDFGYTFVLREVKEAVANLEARMDAQALTTATKVEVAQLTGRIDTLVPRPEHELRWKYDDERTSRLNDKIDDLSNKVDVLVAGNIPTRLDKVERTLEELPGKIFRGVSGVVTLIAAIVAILGWLILHFHS